MAGSTFGSIFKVTTFGESHGAGLGVVIDGVPAGIPVSLEKIQAALDRRKPGAKSPDGAKNPNVTARSEADQAKILSGVFNGYSTGTPLTLYVENQNQHSKDYSEISVKPRPGHADYSFLSKYGFRDYTGGGRSSGRETLCRVAAGAVAQMVIDAIAPGLKVIAYTKKACGIECTKINLEEIEQNAMRAADNEAAQKMLEKIREIAASKDSAGGIIECRVTGVPAGLGEPVFDKCDALLAQAMLSVGAVKGIEFGAGFDAADLTGSVNNDCMKAVDGKVEFLSNNAGGILGGITNGNEIIFRVAVKPVPSIFVNQQTVELAADPDKPFDPQSVEYKNTGLTIQGRHDVCLCPRIVPVIEAMAQITLCDLLLRSKTSRV